MRRERLVESIRSVVKHEMSSSKSTCGDDVVCRAAVRLHANSDICSDLKRGHFVSSDTHLLPPHQSCDENLEVILAGS